MASRSFKPASYLASAAQPSNRRPSFARTSSSSSSIHSTKSDDSFIATLRSLTISDKREGEFASSFGSSVGTGGASPRCHTPASTSRQFFDDTPGRKRSQPIAIELPSSRERAACTPLSARGDLPGGYFPNHEAIQKQYTSHPFSKTTQSDSALSSPIMSNASSAMGSPADTTPTAPALISPAFRTAVPETLTMPIGKYHPSNYKHVAPAMSPAPTSVPPTHLEIPARKKNKRPGHERRTSDVKRKLQQYQRDMIAQARLASPPPGGAVKVSKPISPRLLPLGSPGPITPLELEESAGYMVAGARTGSSGIEKERETVERMIREEERRMGNREGSGSPVLI